MDLGDLTQLAFVAMVTLVCGRIGWSFARLIDRRGIRPPVLPDDAAERIRTLEARSTAPIGPADEPSARRGEP